MSHLLDRLTFFRQKKEQFSEGHGVTTAEARDAVAPRLDGRVKPL